MLKFIVAEMCAVVALTLFFGCVVLWGAIIYTHWAL